MFILIFLAVTGFFIVIGCFAILVIISLVLYMIRICRGDEETDTPPHGHKSYYNCSETVSATKDGHYGLHKFQNKLDRAPVIKSGLAT